MDDFGLEVIMEAIVTTIVLAICLPTFFFCLSTLQTGMNFGFNTLDEKSTMTTSSQLAGVGLVEGLEKKKLWTNAHVLMTAAVDDNVEGGGKFVLKTETYESELRYDSMSFLDKGSIITTAMNTLRSGNFYDTAWYGGSLSFTSKRYYLTLGSDGHLIYTTDINDVMIGR